MRDIIIFPSNKMMTQATLDSLSRLNNDDVDRVIVYDYEKNGSLFEILMSSTSEYTQLLTDECIFCSNQDMSYETILKNNDVLCFSSLGGNERKIWRPVSPVDCLGEIYLTTTLLWILSDKVIDNNDPKQSIYDAGVFMAENTNYKPYLVSGNRSVRWFTVIVEPKDEDFDIGKRINIDPLIDVDNMMYSYPLTWVK